MYSPLPYFLYIKPYPITKEIKNHGYGLFTSINLLPNTNLGISHVYHDWFEDGWIRTPLGGFYNYSYAPTCELRKSIMDVGFRTEIKLLYTTTTIEAGYEITCADTASNLQAPVSPTLSFGSTTTTSNVDSNIVLDYNFFTPA